MIWPDTDRMVKTRNDWYQPLWAGILSPGRFTFFRHTALGNWKYIFRTSRMPCLDRKHSRSLWPMSRRLSTCLRNLSARQSTVRPHRLGGRIRLVPAIRRHIVSSGTLRSLTTLPSTFLVYKVYEKNSTEFRPSIPKCLHQTTRFLTGFWAPDQVGVADRLRLPPPLGKTVQLGARGATAAGTAGRAGRTPTLCSHRRYC